MTPAHAIYHLASKLSARWLGLSPVVESVYVHRSVATGEVSFGRSDIDLLVIVRRPRGERADGPETAALYGWLRLARLANPALGHIEIHDPVRLERWIRIDTYRGSQDRRSALRLYGNPVAWKEMPVRREDAVRRFAVWAEGFFPVAVRQRNRRNLRKIALEMWCTFATATGLFEEPCLTRPEMAARWAASEQAPLLETLTGDPFRAFSVVFHLAKALHDSLLPPLGALRDPLAIQLLMPPRYRQRTLVVLPDADSPLPREAFQPGSFLCTPETFDLCLHYQNPFLAWVCPPQLTALGMAPPATADFVRAAVFFGHNHAMWYPGFQHPDTWTPAATVAVIRHALPYLESGRIPPPLDERLAAGLAADRPSIRQYYRHVFPRVYRESEEQWERLQRLS
jgi:predicted nucleotidyltransferase